MKSAVKLLDTEKRMVFEIFDSFTAFSFNRIKATSFQAISFLNAPTGPRPVNKSVPLTVMRKIVNCE